jgi:hypothetical protein
VKPQPHAIAAMSTPTSPTKKPPGSPSKMPQPPPGPVPPENVLPPMPPGPPPTENIIDPKKKREREEDDDRRKKKKRITIELERDLDNGIGWPSGRPREPRYRHGWFLPTHERVFERVLADVGEVSVILELGSWYGSSTEWLCERCPGAAVYAVDLWDDSFILDKQRDHYSTMGDRKLENLLNNHPLWDTFLANLWSFRDQVVPLKMETTQGVQVLKDKGIKPQIIYIDADHHYEPCKKDIQACLRAFPDAILVGDDYGHYESVRNAVTECALEFDKHVHVDQNHCWTYHRMESGTGRTFKPKPKATDSFASLLAGYA